MIGQFKEKSEALVLFHQLLLRRLRRIKMQRIVECESDLLSHHRKKMNFFVRIDIPEPTAKGDVPTLLWAVVRGKVHTLWTPY